MKNENNRIIWIFIGSIFALIIGIITYINFPNTFQGINDSSDVTNTLDTYDAVNQISTLSLSVENNTLITDEGDLFIFRGVTSNAFRFKSMYENSDTLMRRINQISAWGINAIQFYLNPEIFDTNNSLSEERFKTLYEIIQWGKERNIHIVLSPVNDVTWVNGKHQARKKV